MLLCAHAAAALAPNSLLRRAPRLPTRAWHMAEMTGGEASIRPMELAGSVEGKVVPTSSVSSWYDSGVRLTPALASKTKVAKKVAGVAERVVNVAEFATGIDLDGDGDVGLVGAPRDDTDTYIPLTMDSLESENPAIYAFLLLASYLVLGVGVYWTATDFTLLDSLYYVVITLTSVGFGDLTVDTDTMRLFTCGYILVGVGILGTALGEVISSLLKTEGTPAGKVVRWLSGTPDNTENDENFNVVSALQPTLATVAVTIGLGSIALKYFDPNLSPIEALYYSVVTVSTVGYGDYAPKSGGEKVFLIGYALVGTILLARSLAAIADIPLERRRRVQQKLVLEQCAPLTSFLCVYPWK